MLTASQSLYYEQRRASDARAMLDKLLAGSPSGPQLHSFHPILFQVRLRHVTRASLPSLYILHKLTHSFLQAHVDSINVCDALDDTQASIDHCAEVVRCADAVLPPNSLETSNYYYYLGMLCTELLAKKHQNEHSTKIQPEEIKRRAREAFRQCLAMRSVWFGVDHPCTIKAREKMESI